MNRDRLMCLVGPTATGKTALSVALAERVRALEVVSADSMAVYKYLDRGTAKPSLAERKKVPHHLVDFLDPAEQWSAFDFQIAAHRCIKEIQERKGNPLVVGGTGFYLETLYRPFAAPGAPPDRRIRITLERFSGSQLFALLRSIDLHRAHAIGNRNRPRLIRAIELYLRTGKIPSVFARRESSTAQRHVILLGLTMKSENVLQRIRRRVHRMFEEGLVEEVEDLLARGYRDDIPAFRNFTYTPVVEYIRGERTLSAARDTIIQGTVHLYKRQRTWYRKHHIHWFRADETTVQDIAGYIVHKYF